MSRILGQLKSSVITLFVFSLLYLVIYISTVAIVPTFLEVAICVISTSLAAYLVANEVEDVGVIRIRYPLVMIYVHCAMFLPALVFAASAVQAFFFALATILVCCAGATAIDLIRRKYKTTKI